PAVPSGSARTMNSPPSNDSLLVVSRCFMSSLWCRHRGSCGIAGATVAVPVSLDPMTSRQIAMHGGEKSEQAAVGPVPEQVAPDFDGVARPHVFALDAHFREPAW